MEKDFCDGVNNFNPYMNMQTGIDMNDMYKDPMFNPIAQYEQAYSYYRYLCMQMDYKIKCKEYEKMCQKGRRKIIAHLGPGIFSAIFAPMGKNCTKNTRSQMGKNCTKLM